MRRKKRHKSYQSVIHPWTGQRVAKHRFVVEQALGRALLPGEVVHHKDGDSLNNALSNLVVISSQQLHASLEFHGRRAKTGMPSLFPEHLPSVPPDCLVLNWQHKVPPPRARGRGSLAPRQCQPIPVSLFEGLEQ